MSKRPNKSTSPLAFETIISVTFLALVFCCLLCKHVSCVSVEESDHQNADDNTFAGKTDDAGDIKKVSSIVNNFELNYEDFTNSRSVLRDNFSSPKSSCNIVYMVVSTIDGKVSALDLRKQGSVAWSIEADSHPLYSSSLAQMEIVRDGKKIRLIPSLDGAIYQYDGDKVEAIPMSADSLLSSTYRLSDDSMIVGSKDIRNYGVNLKTGQVHFTCGSDGCTNLDETGNLNLSGNDVVIVTRSTQIVRSVEMKNGNEKWNFSVGEHRLSLPAQTPQSQIEDEGKSKDNSIPFFTIPKKQCPDKEKDADEFDYESMLQLLVPEGKVVALDKKQSRKVAWEHKFESPIAKAWILRNGKLEAMNLFDPKHVPTLNAFTSDDLENESISQPLLYIGSHNKLLYIQPSPQMETILKTFPNHRIGHVFDPKIKVSWRPYLNTASARTPIFGGNRQHIMHGIKQDKEEKDTSLTVWHEDYPFDTGYFLYPEFRDGRSSKKGQMLLIENLHQSPEQPSTMIESLLSSLVYYWKEITSLTVIVSIINMICIKFLVPYLLPVTEPGDFVDSGIHDISNNHDHSSSSENVLNPLDISSEEYVSRFETDFDCLECLGKGGFGIVFKAVNKLDGQPYAVKRIMLPKSNGAKEKVLREVKALAQLEHPGIVRYFNSWEESPPPGWQKQWDKRQGLCDDSRETLYTSTTTQKTEQSLVKETKFVPRRNFRSDPCLETATNDTDSILFLPESGVNTSSQTGIVGSGSGEFSVHSDLSETDSWSLDFSKEVRDENKLFTFRGQTLLSSDTSQSGSKSSIPFSNYTNSSKINENSDTDLSGDSVVFEASNSKFSKGLLPKDSVQSSKHSVLFTISNEEDEKDKCEQAQSRIPGNTFFVFIQTQLYQKETLKDWLLNNTLNRQRQVVLEIFDQITCAVDYVHSHDMMHRDLKPSNIFFAADGTVKVGDFGLATALSAKQDNDTFIGEMSSMSTRHTADVGTTLYMSPEQENRKPYNLKVDIFALGIIFLELWVPFSTQMERHRTLQEAKKQLLPSRLLRELPIESELVKQMTSLEPCHRPCTKEILNHDLLKDVAFQRIDVRKRTRTISDTSSN